MIPTTDRVLARSLARRVVEALVDAGAKAQPATRDGFLEDLLDRDAT